MHRVRLNFKRMEPSLKLAKQTDIGLRVPALNQRPSCARNMPRDCERSWSAVALNYRVRCSARCVYTCQLRNHIFRDASTRTRVHNQLRDCGVLLRPLSRKPVRESCTTQSRSRSRFRLCDTRQSPRPGGVAACGLNRRSPQSMASRRTLANVWLANPPRLSERETAIVPERLARAICAIAKLIAHHDNTQKCTKLYASAPLKTLCAFHAHLMG